MLQLRRVKELPSSHPTQVRITMSSEEAQENPFAIYAQGPVTKWSGFLRSSWKDRYLQVNSQNVCYYANIKAFESDKSPLGVISAYAIEESEDNPLQLKFVGVKNSILIKCVNSDEKAKWLTAFGKFKTEQPDLLQAFTSQAKVEWKDAAACIGCGTQFGFFVRKHHCRVCGWIFCNPCSAARARIPRLGFKNLVRICDACYLSEVWGAQPVTEPRGSVTIPRSHQFCQVASCGNIEEKAGLCAEHLAVMELKEDDEALEPSQMSANIETLGAKTKPCPVCSSEQNASSVFCTTCGFAIQGVPAGTDDKKEAPPEKVMENLAIHERGRMFLDQAQKQKREAEDKTRSRVDDAMRWVDKELRKLIHEISQHGSEGEAGFTQIKYGTLFKETQDVFEALSGTLMTAKKRGVVDYEGQLLLQRVHDEVVITLLQTEIEDSEVPSKPRTLKPKKKAFGTIKMKPEACAKCGKTVYLLERVGAAGKVYHKQSCFKCSVCERTLNAGDFCCVDGALYCKPHYKQKFQTKGGKY